MKMKNAERLARQIVADDLMLYLDDFTDEEMNQIAKIIDVVIERVDTDNS